MNKDNSVDTENQATAANAAKAQAKSASFERSDAPIGDDLSFEGIEAFNLLRTNLMFSFSDDKKCHIVGVCSAIPGSGKSLITANLAYSMAKAEKRVLLIDGDLRIPTIADKLRLVSKPGLSNLLVSAENPRKYLQRYAEKLDVLVAGDIPPKPSELLGSPRMEEILKVLSEYYEYIIFDLTPVTVVPDALAVSRYIDGMIVVVRRDNDEKPGVVETMRQLQLAKVKILGAVFNGGSAADGYYKKGYYKKGGYGKAKYYNTYYR